MGTFAQQRPSVPARTAILTSTDASFRQRLRDALTDLRWQVREAAGGAETLAQLDEHPAEAVVLDSWLPDLEIREFIEEFRRLHAGVDLVMADASSDAGSPARSPRRNEVLHALRRAQATDGAIWNTAPAEAEMGPPVVRTSLHLETPVKKDGLDQGGLARTGPLPEFVGGDACLLEVSRRIRLVAARSTRVLVEGPTGMHRPRPRCGGCSRRWHGLRIHSLRGRAQLASTKVSNPAH